MPEHIHLILTPQSTVERSMQFIKGGFSRRATIELASQMEIWQKGFNDHRIRDWEDYTKYRRYIVMNPVKARLCSAPEEYPYSSACGRFELDEVPQRLKPVPY